MWKKLSLIAILLAVFVPAAHCQILDNNRGDVDADSVRRAFDKLPSFGLYKDNYFIFGTSIGPRPTRENSNVKFQLSIAQRLTKSVLPWGTYLYLFYTQRVIWNVMEKSFPMHDLNFNPGIGLAKPLFVKGRFIGKLTLQAEHESNGRDGIESRSWNRVSLGANILIDPNFIVHGKFWIPFIDGENNKDLLDYMGIYQVGTQIMSPNRRWGVGITMVKRKGWTMNYNTIIEFSYRLFKRDNQYLFAQYYNGYGEYMLDYNKFQSVLRVGFVIKPRLFSDY